MILFSGLLCRSRRSAAVGDSILPATALQPVGQAVTDGEAKRSMFSSAAGAITKLSFCHRSRSGQGKPGCQAGGIILFFLEPLQARGCTDYPHVDDHRIIAEEAIPFFRSLIGP